jgi:serine/threonine-protein kinase
LQQLREQLAMLGARATACRDGLNSLARGQAASGMGLRGDMVEAASLMNSYLDGSNRAINAGDAPAAKDFLQKAERQVEKIEKFLGR